MGTKIRPIVFKVNTPEPSQATLIYSDTTAYETASGNGIQYAVDFSDYTYALLQIAIKKGGNAPMGNDMNIALEFASASWDSPGDMDCIWKFQLDSNTGSKQPVRLVSGSSAQTQATTFTKDHSSSVLYRNYSGNQFILWYDSTNNSNYAVHSLLINTSTNTATHYLNGTITGSGNLVTNGKFNYLAKAYSGSLYLCHKDLYVYGSNAEQDLIDIIQGN